MSSINSQESTTVSSAVKLAQVLYEAKLTDDRPDEEHWSAGKSARKIGQILKPAVENFPEDLQRTFAEPLLRFVTQLVDRSPDDPSAEVIQILLDTMHSRLDSSENNSRSRLLHKVIQAGRYAVSLPEQCDGKDTPILGVFQADIDSPVFVSAQQVQKLIGSSIAILSLPASYADHPLLWPLLVSEFCGPSITQSLSGLLPEVRAALGPPRGRLMWMNFGSRAATIQFSRCLYYWSDELLNDVYATLTFGPAYGIVLSSWLAAIRRGQGLTQSLSLLNHTVSHGIQPIDASPVDILRPVVISGVINGLSIMQPPEKKECLDELISACTALSGGAETIEAQGELPVGNDQFVPIEVSVSSRQAVTGVSQLGWLLSTLPFAAVGGNSLQMLRTWTSSDAATTSRLAGKLSGTLADGHSPVTIIAAGLRAIADNPENYAAVSASVLEALNNSSAVVPPGAARINKVRYSNGHRPISGTKSMQDVPDSNVDLQHHGVAGEKLPGDMYLQVSLVLNPTEAGSSEAARKKVEQVLGAHPADRPQVSTDEYSEAHALSNDHVRQVCEFAHSHGLKVVEISDGRHEVVLGGAARDVSAAFDVELIAVQTPTGIAHAHRGAIKLPRSLRGVVESVTGLDSLPLRKMRGIRNYSDGRLVSPREFEKYYEFPKGTTGAGQRVAVVAIGGGYHPGDIAELCKKLGHKPPVINDVCVGGAKNDPLEFSTLSDMVALAMTDYPSLYKKYKQETGISFMNTYEVTMDIALIAALAPGVEIDVYFVRPNLTAYRTAIYAALGLCNRGLHAIESNAEHKIPNIISNSFDELEFTMGKNRLHAANAALFAAAKRNVTVCCASGDFGSLGHSTFAKKPDANGMANVMFPASSPYVLSCGGTTVELDENGAITGEKAWNAREFQMQQFASGGGVSGILPEPDYQKSVKVPDPASLQAPGTWIAPRSAEEPKFRGRGIPDVVANADEHVGYHIILGGRDFYGGGTSAAAPVWAALIARINEKLKYPVGWIHQLLYEKSVAKALRKITSGDNSIDGGKVPSYRAEKNWNACTGLGAPSGERLVEAIKALRKKKA